MRAQVFFPSCWDGQNLDSEDHKSHMAYPIGAYNDGSCPDTHPVHLISLFYELFAPVGDFPYNGAGTWSFSNGDTNGYRYHGDFQMGWKDSSLLQEFIDNCPGAQGNVADCPALAAVMDTTAASACQFQGQIVNEDIGDVNPIASLPGCNKPWNGNGTQPTCDGDDNPGLVDAIMPLPSGWTDVGCIAEGTSGRALTNVTFTGNNMTKAVCSAMCANETLPYAGLEDGNVGLLHVPCSGSRLTRRLYQQCFCGEALMNGAVPSTLPAEQCNSRCSGNGECAAHGSIPTLTLTPVWETCGGQQKLELIHNPNPIPVTLPLTPPTTTPSSSGNANPSIPSPSSGSSSANTQWVNTSCNKDGSSRALTGYAFASDQMTPALCQAACAEKGFTVAGLEYGAECYCKLLDVPR